MNPKMKNLMKKVPLLCLAIVPLIGGRAVAQETGAVNGLVVSAADGTPLAGVSVRVKDGAAASGTDDQGRFAINAAADATLVFSYVGYATQELPVSGSFMNVRLEAEHQGLDEVVVVGYGTQKKENLTGRSEEHTSELQSLMRISYAGF